MKKKNRASTGTRCRSAHRKIEDLIHQTLNDHVKTMTKLYVLASYTDTDPSELMEMAMEEAYETGYMGAYWDKAQEELENKTGLMVDQLGKITYKNCSNTIH